MCTYIYIYIIEGSLEVKLPTIWTDEKQRWEESDKEKRRRKKIKKEKVSEERRSRCAKRWESRGALCFSNDLWGAEAGGQMRNEKLPVVVARSTSPSQNVQSTPTVDHF